MVQHCSVSHPDLTSEIPALLCIKLQIAEILNLPVSINLAFSRFNPSKFYFHWTLHPLMSRFISIPIFFSPSTNQFSQLSWHILKLFRNFLENYRFNDAFKATYCLFISFRTLLRAFFFLADFWVFFFFTLSRSCCGKTERKRGGRTMIVNLRVIWCYLSRYFATGWFLFEDKCWTLTEKKKKLLKCFALTEPENHKIRELS